MEERPIRPAGADIDDEMIESIRRSLKDIDEGRTVPAREAIASLGRRRKQSGAANRGNKRRKD